MSKRKTVPSAIRAFSKNASPFVEIPTNLRERLRTALNDRTIGGKTLKEQTKMPLFALQNIADTGRAKTANVEALEQALDRLEVSLPEKVTVKGTVLSFPLTRPA